MPLVIPRVVPNSKPFAVNRVICVSSDISATPFFYEYSVMPLSPYLLNICSSLRNSTTYPNASPAAPPIKQPRNLSISRIISLLIEILFNYFVQLIRNLLEFLIEIKCLRTYTISSDNKWLTIGEHFFLGLSIEQ